MTSKEIIFGQLCGSKIGKLRTSRPDDGYAAYVWRWLRFHAGIDPTLPVSCFFYLQNQLDKDGIKANVAGIIDAEGRKILDSLDAIEVEMEGLFKLPRFNGVVRWKGLLY